ncbi:hypothetical protein MTF66_29030 [Pseudoalteromonas sp. 2CM39R]|uniref:hypothetical protein n=1 Tax=Pseudoalteromonas sp. 2CM39R TaxID=2929856 RepID=UPI0020BDF477|nr:hypothetical protein [Pseudoalteromonas sp. 2CM39R]MCK8129089.1 hypothetical protein [Pseudoalteromonas sp. 2CM39R]
MGICAYCKNEEKLTKEHVMPSFVYKYMKDMGQGSSSGWNEKAQKQVGSEFVVKDVCAPCNNVVLGELDAHAKVVVSETGVFTPLFTAKTVKINYEYDLLLRWLLKVAFNSSRGSGINEGVFDKFTNLILGKNCDYSEVVISAGLLRPYKLELAERQKYGKDLNANNYGYVNPFFTRISWAPNTPKEFYTKQIIIGALIFHVVVFTSGVIRNDRKRLKKEYLKMCKGMTIIRQNTSNTLIKQTPLSFIDSMEHQVLRESQLST